MLVPPSDGVTVIDVVPVKFAGAVTRSTPFGSPVTTDGADDRDRVDRRAAGARDRRANEAGEGVEPRDELAEDRVVEVQVLRLHRRAGDRCR